MKKLKNLILPFTILIAFISCKDNSKTEETMDSEVTDEMVVEAPVYYENGKLEVITEAMEFYTADTINSGWNTIVYHNESPETHFIMLDMYPSDTLTMDNVKNELLPPFDEGMRLLMEEKPDSAMAAFGKIPAWFADIRFLGGTGLISAGQTATSTINLEPGKYLMECYVKMANGEWHTSHGMAKFIRVLDEPTNLKPSAPDYKISISSTEGIKLEGEPTSGKRVFEVNFIDQKPYEHFMGHDVNLVKYEDGIDLSTLIHWMNWMYPDGLRTPTPGGITFLGGVNNCEAGMKGYFEAELEPGNYLLIAEVPDADKKGMFKKFTVK
ncbi:hypothetical protein [Aegicerativicinus sediminis]|uniref:hypothetical protein n=1 Tax=Aegicerativicinus sediminis TaxID=2893202 RepID=UPI001E2BC59B|nr:hypothetical protein [Aegicerativicinus sediminis]